jgi:hypothetical protein
VDGERHCASREEANTDLVNILRSARQAMTNSDWWDRAKLPPRPQPIEVRKRELLATLRNGEHAVTLEKRDVLSIGEELILSVDGRGGGCL